MHGRHNFKRSVLYAGWPVIPAIAANNVSLWDALKLVCRVTKFKFVIEEGPVVMVMPEGMTTEALVTRTYDVTENFAERMSGAAEDVQDMAGGFGGGNKSSSEEKNCIFLPNWRFCASCLPRVSQLPSASRAAHSWTMA